MSRKTKAMGKIFHAKVEIDNITFDSKTEAKFYTFITTNKDRLNIKSIELQPEFELQPKFISVNDVNIVCEDEKEFKKLQKKYPRCTTQAIKYIADFKITYNDDSVHIIDVKGIKTADFKIKEKMFNFKYSSQYGKLKCIHDCRGRWLTSEEMAEEKRALVQKGKKASKQKKNKKDSIA